MPRRPRPNKQLDLHSTDRPLYSPPQPVRLHYTLHSFRNLEEKTYFHCLLEWSSSDLQSLTPLSQRVEKYRVTWGRSAFKFEDVSWISLSRGLVDFASSRESHSDIHEFSRENSFVQNPQNLFSDSERSSDLLSLFNGPSGSSVSVQMPSETVERYLQSDVTFVTEVERPSTIASLGPLAPATLHFVQVQAVSADGLLSAPSGLYFYTANTYSHPLSKLGKQASVSARKPKARSKAERKSRVPQKGTVHLPPLSRSAAESLFASQHSLSCYSYSVAPVAFAVLVQFALL